METRKIKLYGTAGKGKFVTVDGDYDGEYLDQFKWYLNKAGYVYRRKIKGADDHYTSTGTVYLHHIVLPPKKGYWITFKDGNKLNATSANLEYIEPRMSAMKRKQRVFENTNSGYRGVTQGMNTRNGKTYRWNRWNAHLARKHIGSFATPEEAARAYDAAAFQRYGERAHLNFPREYGLGKESPVKRLLKRLVH